MKRLIEDSLHHWKSRADKMPLLIYGARQVGKTTTIFEFGKTHYANIVTFNFESNAQLAAVFNKDLNPARIIMELESLSGQGIHKGSTLLFFDEREFQTFKRQNLLNPRHSKAYGVLKCIHNFQL